VHDPLLILADEPTGNLDSETGAAVLDLLAELAGSAAKTLLVVTHSNEVAGRADRVFRIRAGALVETAVPRPTGGATSDRSLHEAAGSGPWPGVDNRG
jgi:putative ABC transport system ATP-binding protein